MPLLSAVLFLVLGTGEKMFYLFLFLFFLWLRAAFCFVTNGIAVVFCPLRKNNTSWIFHFVSARQTFSFNVASWETKDFFDFFHAQSHFCCDEWRNICFTRVRLEMSSDFINPVVKKKWDKFNPGCDVLSPETFNDFDDFGTFPGVGWNVESGPR